MEGLFLRVDALPRMLYGTSSHGHDPGAFPAAQAAHAFDAGARPLRPSRIRPVVVPNPRQFRS